MPCSDFRALRKNDPLLPDAGTWRNNHVYELPAFRHLVLNSGSLLHLRLAACSHTLNPSACPPTR